MTKQQEALLSLIRLGIGHQSISSKSVDWKAVEELAYEQGLSAVLIDGMEKLPVDIRPPKEKLLKLIGEILQGYEYRYENWGAPKNLDIKRKDYARVKESREYTSENQGYPSD